MNTLEWYSTSYFLKNLHAYNKNQFAFGGLLPTGDTLRMIEEATNSDPVPLQQGFDSYNECNEISIFDMITSSKESI